MEINDILNEVENWFCNNCREDGYYNFRDRYKDLNAMASHANDMMVDYCIDYLDLTDEEIEEYVDEIENKLAELASEEI